VGSVIGHESEGPATSAKATRPRRTHCSVQHAAHTMPEHVIHNDLPRNARRLEVTDQEGAKGKGSTCLQNVRRREMASADPSTGSVPLPSSSNKTRLSGPAVSRMTLTRAMWPENVDKLCSRDWLSPRSASTFENTAICTPDCLEPTKIAYRNIGMEVGPTASPVKNKCLKVHSNRASERGCKAKLMMTCSVSKHILCYAHLWRLEDAAVVIRISFQPQEHASLRHEHRDAECL
jgi:hypothetical protein